MGTALLSGHQSIRLKDDMTMFSSYGLGEMGYGLPGALGAAIAGNGREVDHKLQEEYSRAWTQPLSREPST